MDISSPSVAMSIRHQRSWTCLVACAILIQSARPAFADSPRDTVLAKAKAYWRLGEGGDRATYSLKTIGKIEDGLAAEGTGAIKGHKVARLTAAYFDAGKKWSVQGEQITVYLRVRDPRGQWNGALFAKRGGHQQVNYNLYSAAANSGEGAVIGFELHTERGFFAVHFPISKINPAAWHDLAGRYDGQTIALLCDGKVMARQRCRGALTQNDEPLLIGAETEAGKIVRPFTGEMEEAALWTQPLTDQELATVMHQEALLSLPLAPEPWVSPIHYRPRDAILADTIPFFWKGDYHIFYLSAGHGGTPWEHIVSRDLLHWKELPTALPLGKPSDPDGGNVFTGSVIEKDGSFHIFYTGFNPGHPGGREQIMHATSPDLLAWTKHPEDTFGADGVHYRNDKGQDFRDPFVFWNEQDKGYWMLLCARDARTNEPVTGVARSQDLKRWKQIKPLTGGTERPAECPDLFRIGDTWYLLTSPCTGTTDYRWAKDLNGPWHWGEPRQIDTPILYAAKRMFDGKRHVLTGWQRDLEGDSDTGGFRWGGTQCVPREVYSTKSGELLFRPVPEVTAAFTRKALSAVAHPSTRRLALDVPDNYLLKCRIVLPARGTFTLGFRDQVPDKDGYFFTLTPAEQVAQIRGPRQSFERHCPLPSGQPVDLQVYVQGSLIECFVNDGYAYSMRAYNHPHGKLSLQTEGGDVRIDNLVVLILAEPSPKQSVPSKTR